jgi:lon-related putative ATP-dependent protease
MTEPLAALPVEKLRRRVDPDTLPFDGTAALTPLEGLFGQARAEEALRLGVHVRRRGFNLFVLGPTGLGKHGLVERILKAKAASQELPSDWVYVHAFEEPDAPKALSLPPGRGHALVEAMKELVEELQVAIRAAFEGDEYRNRRRMIETRLNDRQEEAFLALAERSEAQGLRFLRTPQGFAFAPIVDGKVLSPQEFNKLPESKQEELKARLQDQEKVLRELMQSFPKWMGEARQQVRELERELARQAALAALDPIKKAFEDVDAVARWLLEVERDIAENAVTLFGRGEAQEDDDERTARAMVREASGVGPSRYEVNLLIDRRGLEGAPVVYEAHPTLDNLVGRVEARQRLGVLVSDFRLIKPGALHKANGGYLILDARRLLLNPSAWDTLKRAIRGGEIRIESVGKALGLASTTLLEPRPIPLDAKLVLIGERRLYYLLSALDPDFDQLFKVAADFEDDVPFVDGQVTDFARLLTGVILEEGLLHLDRGGVARMAEHGVRLADDQGRLTTHVLHLADVLREADAYARMEGTDAIGAAQVRKAIEADRHRLGRVQERNLERYADGTMLVSTEGTKVGQINALSVLALGRSAFGRPNRITCRVRLGRGEVVDIEREVQLGGPIHSKGVLILSSYLGARYGQERPLSVRISLVFEQSYGGVDGDSASLAELCCILSALSDAPLRQDVAMTGSVNQMGEVQAIGGVNEKIEGFFDVCESRGLTGTQGVLIPPANAKNLMLREDIVAACAEGRFFVQVVHTVEEALEVLTGLPVRADDAFHEKVEARLDGFAAAAKRYAESLEKERRDPPPPAEPEPPEELP